jgi:hypothetical protein
VSTDEEGGATATARTQGGGARYNDRWEQVLIRRRCRCRRRSRRRQTCYYAISIRLRRDCHIQNLHEQLFDLAQFLSKSGSI